MKVIRNEKSYSIVIIFLLIIICLFGLKTYSDFLRKEGQRELYEIRNRKAGIEKTRLAQTVWPPLVFDKSYQNLLKDLKAIEQRPALTIVLKEDASNKDIEALVTELQSIKGVEQAKFIPREEAFKKYKEAYQDSPALLEMAQPNMLPQTIDVYSDDFTIGDQIEDLLKGNPAVFDIVQLL